MTHSSHMWQENPQATDQYVGLKIWAWHLTTPGVPLGSIFKLRGHPRACLPPPSLSPVCSLSVCHGRGSDLCGLQTPPALKHMQNGPKGWSWSRSARRHPCNGFLFLQTASSFQMISSHLPIRRWDWFIKPWRILSVFTFITKGPPLSPSQASPRLLSSGL